MNVLPWIDADFFFTVFHIEIRQIALSLAEFSSFGKQSRDRDERTNEKKIATTQHIHYTFISKKAKMN